ncbi:NAD(P)H-binding protein [Micromonospora sp. NPDC004551]|uniref:NAD(P)-dependent oxidoreductase n=1 Tax=Micromonospora sp. NPDC004551 TaxID=3154284 RepID=UPI0033A1846A
MKLAVFGASGATGRLLVEQACAAGHQVTAVVRDPDRLRRSHPLLTVLCADVTDPAQIGPAVEDADAVVSTVGPGAVRAPTTVRADAVTGIIRAMHSGSARRLIVVTAGGIVTDGDGPLTRLLLKPILGRVLRHSYADMRRTETIVRDSGLAWTIVRPPRLTDGPYTGTYRRAVNRNVRGGLSISRADLADCILRCAADRDLVNAAVAIGR